MFMSSAMIGVGWFFYLLLEFVFGRLPEQIFKRSFGRVGALLGIGQCAYHDNRVL